MKKVYIIAEAGVNHNGSLDMALQLADKAKEIGADCVKYQTFKAEQIVTNASPKANYQMQVTDQKESQFEMLKKLELQKEDFAKIKEHCAKIGIEFLSTPYNPEDADLLNSLGVRAFKIASGQTVETPFLKYVAAFKKQMIISSGMCDLNEVREGIEAIRSTGNDDIILLQCNTDYPSKITDTNLRAMLTMGKELNVRIGYSDHVPNNYACFAAVAMGAEVR
jgi:N-acetylneuraminate synthase/N,N'-diacetyllegionaminate synthase